MLISLAWRNIWRNPKRSGILMGAVVLGISTGIFLTAFYNGMVEQRVKSAIQSEISHLQLHLPAFIREQDIRYPLNNSDSMLRVIRRASAVKAAAGRLIVNGMIASPSGSAGITINGISPLDEDSLTRLAAKLISGKYFGETGPNSLLAGAQLLKKLKLKAGKKAVLSFQDSSGNLVAAAFRITGVFKTVNSPYDAANVFVPLRTLDSLAGMPGTCNEIAVLLQHNNQVPAVQDSFRLAFPGTTVRNWKEISPETGLTVTVARQMVFILMGIILLALAFGIVNTMLMAILERTRETGMLLALGMSRLKIGSMILLETLLLVLASAPVGAALAWLAVDYTGRHGIRFSQFREVYASFGYADTVYPQLDPTQLLESFLMIIFTTLLAAVFPAWKALRTDPVTAVKNY